MKYKYYVHYCLENYNPEIEDYDAVDEVYEEFATVDEAVAFCREMDAPHWVKVQELSPRKTPANLGNYTTDEF